MLIKLISPPCLTAVNFCQGVDGDLFDLSRGTSWVEDALFLISNSRNAIVHTCFLPKENAASEESFIC